MALTVQCVSGRARRSHWHDPESPSCGGTLQKLLARGVPEWYNITYKAQIDLVCLAGRDIVSTSFVRRLIVDLVSPEKAPPAQAPGLSPSSHTQANSPTLASTPAPPPPPHKTLKRAFASTEPWHIKKPRHQEVLGEGQAALAVLAAVVNDIVVKQEVVVKQEEP